MLVISAARLATVLPQHTAEANGTLQALVSTLASYGVGPDQLRALAAGLDNAGWLNALLGSPAAVRRLSHPPEVAGIPPQAD